MGAGRRITTERHRAGSPGRSVNLYPAGRPVDQQVMVTNLTRDTRRRKSRHHSVQHDPSAAPSGRVRVSGAREKKLPRLLTPYRSAPPGPHPINPDGMSVSVPVRGDSGRWVRVSPEDYRLGMSRPWREISGYPAVWTFDTAKGRGLYIALHSLVLRGGGGLVIDHIDRDPLNATRGNLRRATVSQNGANRTKKAGTSSRFRGVTQHKQTGKWQAAATYFGRCIYLGLYVTEEAAARAYDAKARELWPGFCSVNFPEQPTPHASPAPEALAA